MSALWAGGTSGDDRLSYGSKFLNKSMVNLNLLPMLYICLV